VSWLRIWNPELFLILTRGPFFYYRTNRRREKEKEDSGRPTVAARKAWPRLGHVPAVEAAAQWGTVASAAGQQGHTAERRQPWWLRSGGAGGGESEPGGGEG